MKKFITKILIFFLPFVVLNIYFIVSDPFLLFWEYDEYRSDDHTLNYDFVNTERYKKKAKVKKYDSFILGSSRAGAFKADKWEPYLDAPENCYNFLTFAESLFGAYIKLRYFDKRGEKINNVLWIICTDCTFNNVGPGSGHLFRKHPEVAESSWLPFYREHFNAFCTMLIQKYILNTWQGKNTTNKTTTATQPIPGGPVYNSEEPHYNQHLLNQFHQLDLEKPSTLKAKFEADHRALLYKMKLILEKHQTKIKIVISPLYDKKSINPKDLKILHDLFGKENVHDFSGVNDITQNYRNYLETSHYRDEVGERIMKEIYQGTK